MDTKRVIERIIEVLPKEWKGTTFKNDNLLGREGFAQKLDKLLEEKGGKPGDITTEDLDALGNAEDYLRVATNVSVTLEVFLARERGCSVEQVFTFSSKNMPLLAVYLTTNLPVHLYVGTDPSPFTHNQLTTLQLFGGPLEIFQGNAPNSSKEEIVLAFESAVSLCSKIDGIITSRVLYITNPAKIRPADILVVRKRMAIPMSTPMAISTLSSIAQHTIEAPIIDSAAENKLLEHLQRMSGAPVDLNSSPVLFSAGLPATASLWITLASTGGAEIVMASTAYGGSSQLVDILTARSKSLLRKHTFDIQGVSSLILERIEASLNILAARDDILPNVVLFAEIPTNPDMKVPDPSGLAKVLRSFADKTKRKVLLLIDTTFAPTSRVLQTFRDLDEELPSMAFISLSKSVSRGYTTGGTLVAGHSPFAIELLNLTRETSKLLDTSATPDQVQILIENHEGVEQRCLQAYQVAAAIGERLCAAVKKHCNFDMPLAFPTPQHAAIGFSSSTFSFNLPALEGVDSNVNAALAQRFVDLLCEHREFKPCVSFGQDNGLVYATVPATSTQGAIKEEDKAKQAVGGVQLVRLSFSPSVNVDAASQILENALLKIYAK